MNPLKSWYLITIIFFTGTAGYLIWVERGKLLKKHWKFVLGYLLFTVPWAYWDGVALRWKAYQYNPSHTLGIKIFGSELETYIFMGLVGAVVCSATVIYMQEEEKGRLKLRHRSRRQRRRRSNPRKLVSVPGATRR